MVMCEICTEYNLGEYADPNLNGVCVFCTDEEAM